MINKRITMIIVLQIIILSLLQIASSQEQIVPQGTICRKSDNISTTSIYHDNIVSLLNNLTNQSSKSKFFQTSSGIGANRVNGLYVCRPDLPLDTCNSCVNAAVTRFNQVCSTKKQAIAWYQQCMVRYTNLTIFATLQTEPLFSFYGLFNVSEPDTFPGLLNNTLEKIITKASMPENKDRFAFSNNTRYTAFEGLQGMAWCTPDIKPSDCNTCLTTASSNIPNDGLAQSALVHLPNCILKYDTAPFIFPKSSTLLPPSTR